MATLEGTINLGEAGNAHLIANGMSLDLTQTASGMLNEQSSLVATPVQ